MILEALSYPFMQRALVAGLFLALLLPALGVFATLRRMAFFGDGIAHASLAGIALALLGGLPPLPVALVWAVLVALYIYRAERVSGVSSDSAVGIFFTASMAFGVIVMSFTRGFQPDLISYLFGSLLSIGTTDLLAIAVVSAAVLTWIAVSYRGLTFLCLAEESANVAGVATERQLLVLYIALALATVIGVKILGIVLVSALLVLPPAVARLMSQTFNGFFFLSLVFGELFVVLGLFLSYAYDLPSGATIVLLGTATFILASLLERRRA